MYLYPSQHLTKLEVYKVLETLGDVPNTYNEIQADTQFMTKGEFASLVREMLFAKQQEDIS